MAIRFITMKCPQCNADLDVEEGRKELFCSYCGTKVMVQNDNEYVIRNVDEAYVKQAETEKLVQLKRLELMQKKQEQKQKNSELRIRISLGLGAVMLLAYLIEGKGSGIVGFGMLVLSIIWLVALFKAISDDSAEDRVKVPASVADYEDMQYTDVEERFVKAGFINVKCIPLHDVTVGIMKKPDYVESVEINGEPVFYDKKYNFNAAVNIYYHSKR